MNGEEALVRVDAFRNAIVAGTRIEFVKLQKKSVRFNNAAKCLYRKIKLFHNKDDSTDLTITNRYTSVSIFPDMLLYIY